MFLNEVYDPASTFTGPNGATLRNPFANNTVPANRLDPVALAIQNYIPLPNAPGITNNYDEPSYTSYQHTTNWSVKLDHSLSSTIKISGYFSRILTYNPNNNGCTGTHFTAGANQQYVQVPHASTTISPSDRHCCCIWAWVISIPMYRPFSATFNEASLGLTGYPSENYFPNFTGVSNIFGGGVNLSASPFGGGAIGPGGFFQNIWDEKPTANANLTWVKNNHTFKFGGEMLIEGFPDISDYRSNGIFAINSTETGNPNEYSQGLTFPLLTGFQYASFLMGQVDNLNINPPQQSKLGDHSLGLYAQDSWKVTRKLTLDYGLRYDYQTYLKEQYGRMPDTVFNITNPVTGTPGATLFEGYGRGDATASSPTIIRRRSVHASESLTRSTPRLYFRGGYGVQYSTQPNNAFLSYNDTVFYSVSGPGYGLPFMNGLTGGNPFAPGNAAGLAPLVYPNFNEGVFPVRTAAGLPPDSPFINIDPSSRPARVMTYSAGLQREINRNIVVEASYVGNRGVWFTAPELDITDYNSLTPQSLAVNGININSPTDQALLLDPISSPAVIQRFPELANPNNVYNGFPNTRAPEPSVPQSSGVSRRASFPGSSSGRHLVQFASGQGDQALFARFAGAGVLHLEQERSPGHQRRHSVLHARYAADQRCVQLRSKQTNSCQHSPACLGDFRNLHHAQVEREQARVEHSARLATRHCTAIPERRAHRNAQFQQRPAD